MMIQLAPSALSCDFSRMGEQCAAMEAAGADLLHLDVMDGHFVPNLTFGAPVVKSLRPRVTMPFDVHLMISEPLRYAGDFIAAGADYVTFHIEASSPAGETIAAIRAGGARPGLVLKPGTPAQAAFPYLADIDMLLVMTVEPGFGGQRFMAGMLPKIAALRDEIARRGLDVPIEVDGGVDRDTAPLVVQAGATVLVAGSALFGQEDFGKAVRELREAAKRNE